VKVALFSTCLGDQLYPQVGRSVVRVLGRFGCEVELASLTTCCGQPAWNSGYAAEARTMARRLIETFADTEYVVSPSGSCCGMIRHYYEQLFQGDRDLQREAQRFAERVLEFSQFMVSILGITELDGAFPHRVTYHPSCHGARLLGARTEPLTLLRAVPELQLVPLAHADDCCGFGGTFSVKLAPISLAMADEKLAHIETTGAEYVVSTDLGCLMNIAGRMRERGTAVEALHLAELVDRALTNRTESA
jgi:L-lactate dehydrogenase complex protein LldE